MKKRYWAVGFNFEYTILKNPSEKILGEYGSVEGPFRSLIHAKLQIRIWIANDRVHLSSELANCLAIRESSFE